MKSRVYKFLYFLVKYKMTSSGPYYEATNFTQMFDMPDLRGPPLETKYCKNSLSGIINNNPDFSKFKYILKLSKLDGIYDDSQADYTLFVPTDDSLKNIPSGVFVNMDMLTARNIIKSSTIKRKITRAILEDVPESLFSTKHQLNRLLVTNTRSGETFLNNTIKVIQMNIHASNGMIHIIDNLIMV